jgi:hypothetical protein
LAVKPALSTNLENFVSHPGANQRLAGERTSHYVSSMVIIRFADQESKRRALGYIARRFPGKSWATGEVMVPEAALASLAAESFHFTVEGPATYERLASLRDTSAAAVQ